MMIRPTSRYLFVALIIMLAAAIANGPAIALEAGRIVDIGVSSDLHKVMIKTQGDIGRHSTSLLDNPPRLVVDFPETGLDLSQGLKTEQKADGMKIRAAKTRSGVRVVLDFSRGRVPEHKILKMGNDLIVFLEDWTTPATAPYTVDQAENPPSPPIGPRVVERQSAPAPTGASDLEIKDARATGDRIVLKVADPKHPGTVYRVELGLDLERGGFTSARVIPPSGRKPSSSPPAATQVRVVPREAAPGTAFHGPAHNPPVNSSAGRHEVLAAPINNPTYGQVPEVDPTGPQGQAAEPEQALLVPTPNRAPRPQPVTESLRAKVYGEEPRGNVLSKWSAAPQTREPAAPRATPTQPTMDSSRRAGPTASIHGVVDQVLGYPNTRQGTR